MQPIPRTLIAAMILGAAGAIPLFYAGPQLYKDMQSTRWVAAPTLLTVASNCTRWSRVVSTCSVHYVDGNAPDRPQQRLNYFFFGSWVEERGTFMRSAVDPNHVTVTLGIEHMADRQAAFAIWSVLVLGVVGLFLFIGVRMQRAGERDQPSFRRRL